MTPPPTTPATSSMLSSGSDGCCVSAVPNGAGATASLREATVCGVVLCGVGGESGITSNRGVVVDVDGRLSRSPPTSGGLAAVATAAACVASGTAGGAELDTSLSTNGRASPDVELQRSRDDSRQGFRSVWDPLSLCGESTDADGPECSCCLHRTEAK